MVIRYLTPVTRHAVAGALAVLLALSAYAATGYGHLGVIDVAAATCASSPNHANCSGHFPELITTRH